MKYIMFKDWLGFETPIIFPDYVQHVDVAQKFSSWTVISAGFLSVGSSEIFVHGASHSLCVCAKEDDAKILTKHFNASR